MKDLTQSEQEVLTLLSKGMKNTEISKNLNISVHTTKSHLGNIFDKLKVGNRVQAVVKAIYYGIVDISKIIEELTNTSKKDL